MLHSVILLMVGANASRRDDTGGPTPLKNIYEHVFPSLIKLATDVDQVTRSLFEPLVLQLIHWFTKNAKYENEETMALLDAIVDTVGNTTDGGIREFSSKCLAEFLKWSLKHTPKKEQVIATLCIVIWLRKKQLSMQKVCLKDYIA